MLDSRDLEVVQCEANYHRNNQSILRDLTTKGAKEYPQVGEFTQCHTRCYQFLIELITAL